MSIMAVLVLIKWLWSSIAMESFGTMDGERRTILRKRNYLSAKIITSPKQVLQEMPDGIGEQFKGGSGFSRLAEEMSRV